jgi:hypothetical protein
VTTDDERIAYLAGDADLPPPGPEARADLDQLRRILADEAVWAEPDPGLEDRVLGAIAAEVATSPRASSRAARSPRRRAIRVVSAVAAAAVAAAVIGVVIARNPKHAGPTLTAALAPTSLAPAASGNATLTRTDAGWRVDLHVAGLPRLDNGRFYEAWMKSSAGVLVPLGTFNGGPQVILWGGVSPQDFPVLTVTQQQVAGPSGGPVLAGPIGARR